MKNRGILSLVAAVALTCIAVSCTQTPTATATSAPKSGASAASNAAGTWTWTYDGGAAGGQAITHTYTLKQNGETLAGTFKDSFDDTTADIKDGRIHNGEVSFTVARPFMDNGTMNFTFTGKLEGKTIKGKATWTMGDQPTTAEWIATRS